MAYTPIDPMRGDRLGHCLTATALDKAGASHHLRVKAPAPSRAYALIVYAQKSQHCGRRYRLSPISTAADVGISRLIRHTNETTPPPPISTITDIDGGGCGDIEAHQAYERNNTATTDIDYHRYRRWRMWGYRGSSGISTLCGGSPAPAPPRPCGLCVPLRPVRRVLSLTACGMTATGLSREVSPMAL